jgi:hypothetical protein
LLVLVFSPSITSGDDKGVFCGFDVWGFFVVWVVSDLTVLGLTKFLIVKNDITTNITVAIGAVIANTNRGLILFLTAILFKDLPCDGFKPNNTS